ncbi:MAG: divalent-cation tolerance protein CutA [Verrucomicrobiota bacterium]|nr:divalent-cation tolerance protein CutA [Chthoniobacterales bacterium]MDQ3414654.1 divalent-cation tolerance protein CutA [Verrucomicrobiota bacterium]
MADEILLVLSTFPDVATARRIGRQLVEDKCAACANLLPAVESIYWWQQKVETASETIVLLKTSADRYEALETTLRQLHPYEVPEIIAFRVEQGLPEYLRWVSENCAS